MLPEDRLQMKWSESEGSSLGYLVQVKPMAGKVPLGEVPVPCPSSHTRVRLPHWHGERGGRRAFKGPAAVSPHPARPEGVNRYLSKKRVRPQASPPEFCTPP